MSRQKIGDLTGQRFGRLVVIERVGTRSRNALWKCKCDCGNEKEVLSGSLANGHTKSCGCFRSQFAREKVTTHGMCKTKLHGVWTAMKARCSNSHLESYSNYGGRGITVGDEWSDFINFYNWANSTGYNGLLTLNRKDNEKGYCPQNCEWSTRKEQANNKRNNVWYEYRGEKKTISQWSDVCGMSYKIIAGRIRAGWDIKQALFTPIQTPYKEVDINSFKQQLNSGKTLNQTCLDFGITKANYYYHVRGEKEKG